MVTITTTFRNLAEISENSPGYSVVGVHTDSSGVNSTAEITSIVFERHYHSGRRNRAIVLANYPDLNGKMVQGRFDSDVSIQIVD
jgi:hypothetical protein